MAASSRDHVTSVPSPSCARGSCPYGADALMLRKAAEELREQLGDEEFSRLLDAGLAMAPDDAVQFSFDALARRHSASLTRTVPTAEEPT